MEMKAPRDPDSLLAAKSDESRGSVLQRATRLHQSILPMAFTGKL